MKKLTYEEVLHYEVTNKSYFLLVVIGSFARKLVANYIQAQTVKKYRRYCESIAFAEQQKELIKELTKTNNNY